MPTKNILLVVAMAEEAQPIIDLFSLHWQKEAFPHLPMQAYAGKQQDYNIHLIINGQDPIHQVENIGSQPATLTTYVGITQFNPDLVISVGTAGGRADRGAQIGDIYLSNKIYFAQRNITLPGYYEYGMGGYHSQNNESIAKKLNLKVANVYSTDSFDEQFAESAVAKQDDCIVRDMEAAGVAWVCQLLHKPMFAIKAIVDIAESKQIEQQFMRNFASITRKLAETLQAVLAELT